MDGVLLGVKAWQVPEAAEEMRPLIGPATFVVPLQNGVEAPAQLVSALGAEHVIGGLCGTLSWLTGPGRIRSIGAVARARRVALPDTVIAEKLALVDSLDPSGTTSLHRGLAEGRPSELEAWNGAVARLDREAGVATPLHEFIYRSLLPRELRARGQVDYGAPDDGATPMPA